MGRFTPGPLSRFYRYDRMLEREIAGDCASLLDVGCGSNSPVRRFAPAIPVRVGVDSFAPALETSLQRGTHTEVRQMNILDIGTAFAPGSFDAVLASDVIEHLAKDEGHRLLAAMERIARHKVVVFTPSGFLRQAAYDGNPMQVHQSGWGADEMRAMGYRVIGVNGWKSFFGERGQITWRPRTLWKFVAIASRGYPIPRPHLAFQMLCVKALPAPIPPRQPPRAARADTA